MSYSIRILPKRRPMLLRLFIFLKNSCRTSMSHKFSYKGIRIRPSKNMEKNWRYSCWTYTLISYSHRNPITYIIETTRYLNIKKKLWNKESRAIAVKETYHIVQFMFWYPDKRIPLLYNVLNLRRVDILFAVKKSLKAIKHYNKFDSQLHFSILPTNSCHKNKYYITSTKYHCARNHISSSYYINNRKQLTSTISTKTPLFSSNILGFSTIS